MRDEHFSSAHCEDLFRTLSLLLLLLSGCFSDEKMQRFAMRSFIVRLSVK